MGAEHLVQHIEDFPNAHVFDAIDRADEVAPEVAQHLAPVDLAVGDAVEIFFQTRGVVVFDVPGEEVFQERDDDAAFILRVQTLLFEAHVVAVFQHL